MSIDYLSPDLPQFFVAEGEQAGQAVRSAIRLLDSVKTPEYMLVRDEVVFAKQWGVMYGLVPDGAAVCVGGMVPHALIRPDSDGNFPESEVKDSNLASLTVSTCLKPLNQRGNLFQVQQMPRSRTTTSEQEFQEIASLLQRCSDENFGNPPSVIAFDGHGSFYHLNATLLGLTDDARGRSAYEFFQQCSTFISRPLPLFSCQTLWYQNSIPVFGTLDPKHIQKARISGSRTGPAVGYLMIFIFVFL